MREVRCQGKEFITTDDVAAAILDFFIAAQRRGRVVRVDVPILHNVSGATVIELVLCPGESIVSTEINAPEADLDTADLLLSLAARTAVFNHRGEN